MALGTITNVAADPHGLTNAFAFGDFKVTVTTVVGDSSYPTGGTALTGKQLGLPVGQVLFTIDQIVASSGSNDSAIAAKYNTSTGNLQMFSGTDGAGVPFAETANTTNVSGLTVQIVAFGY